MKQESAEKPPCFNSEREYEEWKALLVRSREKGVTICDDCTNDYRKKMKAQSRCKPVQAKLVAHAPARGIGSERRTKGSQNE